MGVVTVGFMDLWVLYLFIYLPIYLFIIVTCVHITITYFKIKTYSIFKLVCDVIANDINSKYHDTLFSKTSCFLSFQASSTYL